MGIPGFYRWLLKRCPDTVCSVAEDPFIKGGPKIVTSRPNPNGVEFDNLYIDMNGVIHPCFHPERLPAPQSYDDVLEGIFIYIEKVFSIVRPRKLLFLAIDGVAPRAKMNNQRIRRFRAARETAGEVSAVGSGKAEDEKKLDSNVITPGTEFMDLLSNALRYFVDWKICTDPGWQGIKVILSDSSVVGEGEDKIMSYIRSQRNLPGYDPNMRHCLHGLDADLIMLALATHEINISILREVITYWPDKSYRNQKQKKQKRLYASYLRQFVHGLKFEFFNIWVLREYLEKELLADVEGTDIDRLIDDFVFICFFVGNDFLPRLPSLDVSKGGMELLLLVYQEEFVKMGYLTKAPKVNLKSMEHFLKALSSYESSVFKKHSQLSVEMRMSKRKRGGFQDAVMIHKKHTKQDHYTKNFDCESHDVDRIRRDSVLKYTEGVCWIMHYYYQQVCSWQWFYPYHYAPLASDFCGLDKLEINFTLGQPFKPLDQLLGVLPAASAQALPLFYRELMTNTSSPILDFYPKDAEVDMTGKKHVWQGVCKLPFIDESRLLSETAKVEHSLTDEEKRRNRFGRDRLFVHRQHPLAKFIKKNQLRKTSKLQIKINPELSGGMNGYLCISDKPVCPCNIPSTVVGKLRLRRTIATSVDYKCPSNAHIPKLPRGVIMPPRILRFQDRPRPPVLWHATPTPRVSQSIVSVRKSQKKKRKQDVVLGMAPRQDGSKDEVSNNNEAADGKQNNIIHGTSEAELHLVEGNRGLNVMKSTNQVEHDLAIAKQQEITAGNGIIIEETQREKQQVNVNNRTKSGTNERRMNIEKPLTRDCESSLSLGSEPKIKLKKKRVRGDKLEAQVHLVEVSGGAGQNWAGEREAKGGIMQQQGTEKINKNTVSAEEVPTREMGSSSNQQEPVAALVRKKNTKRRVVKDEEDKKVNGGGSGEKSVDSDKPPTKNKREYDAITGEQVLLFEGINGKKPTNKMESHGRIPPFAEGVSQKVNVEIGENLNNKMDCDLVSQEIDKHDKRKEEKKRKRRRHMSGGEAERSGVDENMHVFEVIEKPKKLEPATKERDEKIKRKQQLNQSSNVKTSEKPPIDSLESDILPSSREQENMDAEKEGSEKKKLEE